MSDPITLAVSAVALSISAVTAWLTLFRRGTVRMTQPTVIYFGPDVPRPGHKSGLPKVYLCTLLFATSKRGRVIESVHVSLERSETRQISTFGFMAMKNWLGAAGCMWERLASPRTITSSHQTMGARSVLRQADMY